MSSWRRRPSTREAASPVETRCCPRSGRALSPAAQGGSAHLHLRTEACCILDRRGFSGAGIYTLFSRPQGLGVICFCSVLALQALDQQLPKQLETQASQARAVTSGSSMCQCNARAAQLHSSWACSDSGDCRSVHRSHRSTCLTSCRNCSHSAGQ